MRAQEKNQDHLKSRQMEERLLNSIKAKERRNSRHNDDVSEFQYTTYPSHPSLPTLPSGRNSRERGREPAKMEYIDDDGQKRDFEPSMYLKNIDQVQPS